MWLPLFRRIAAEVRSRVAPLVGTRRGRQVVGVGASGDRTVYLDALAEEIAVRHLETAYRSGRRFRLLSEELGARDFGGTELILLDPLDGSLNAKYGLPYCAIVLAATSGERLTDVNVALIHNLMNGDEFSAERGKGAFRNNAALEVETNSLDEGRYGLVQLDAPRPLDAVARVQPLIAHSERLRILGSAALNLCYTATGGIAIQVAPLPVRTFDLAGPLLVLREAGGVATDLHGGSLDQVSLTLDTRSTLLASASSEIHAYALTLLQGG